MTNIEKLRDEATMLLNQKISSISELRTLSIQIDDLINSPDYQELDLADKQYIQDLYRDLTAKINLLDSGQPTASPSASKERVTDPESSGENQLVVEGQNYIPEHSSEAVRMMDEAEQLFYGGRYSEAIKLYDQVISM